MENIIDRLGKRVFPIELKGEDGCDVSGLGISKRELFAAMVMQGMLAHSTRYKPKDTASPNWHEAISEEATQLADTLIKALEK